MQIKEIEQAYNSFSQSSMEKGTQIAEGISMLQLNNANEKVVQAVMEIEKLTHKKGKSFLSKLPVLGRFVDKAEDKINEENLKNANISEVVNRLFTSLNEKKNNIVTAMETLYTIKEELSIDVEEMLKLEPIVQEKLEAPGMEGVLAKNLVVQIMPSIIKAKDRIGIIDTTCKAAQATTQSISSLLPTLQGELVTEMAIQGGLQELKEFKMLFDNTMQTVHELTKDNHVNMANVLEDVVDLSVTQSRDIIQIEQMGKNTEDLKKSLANKMKVAREKQMGQIERLSDVRNNQKTLSYLGD